MLLVSFAGSHLIEKLTIVRHRNLQYERACVLFDLAAMYSLLAVNENRSAAEGLKKACAYFQNAAGCFQHLIDVALPEMRVAPPPDMTVDVITTLKNLMLAQAQECFWQKAAMDQLKDGIVAKLAAKVAEYYLAASDGSKEASLQGIFSQEWIVHMRTKYYHFLAAAQYRKSRDVLNQNKYGEEIARLKAAEGSAKKGLESQRYLRQSVLSDLKSLLDVITTSLKRAEKDNDLIYLQNVPSTSAVPPIVPAEMVKVWVPAEVENPISAMNDGSILGAPLFAKLVPFAVHQAASVYADRKMVIVSEEIVGKLEDLSNVAFSTLQSLNLPGSLQALEQPIGLPPTLLRRAEDIRSQGGMERLRTLLQDVSRQGEHVSAILEDAFDILDQEAADDEDVREQYPDSSWLSARASSHEVNQPLTQQGVEFQKTLTAAGKSDELVVEKMETWEHFIDLLAAGREALMEAIPASSVPADTSQSRPAVEALRGLINGIENTIRNRKAMQDEVRRVAEKDDVHAEILKEAARISKENPNVKMEPAQFEDFFVAQLRKYDIYKERVAKEVELQQATIEKVIAANQKFVESRKSNEEIQRREKALQNLDVAASKFNEIMTNLEEGLKFYNDFANVLTNWQQDCKEFSLNRRAEVQSQLTGSGSEIDQSLQQSMDRLGLGSQTANTPSALPLDQVEDAAAAASAASASAREEQPRIQPGKWGGGAISFSR